MSDLVPFLTFQPGRGRSAAEAMSFYVDLFEDAAVVLDQRHGADGAGPEGTVALAEFVVAGQRVRCSDSFVDHEWDFTPAISLWLEVDGEATVRRLFDALVEGGTAFMPVADYGFGLFCWVGDRFGVTWQISVSPAPA